MIYGLLIVLQVIVSILLVVTILLQSSKGGGLAGIAGGMTSTVFGGRTAANFLQKATSILAVIFLANCLLMAVLSGGEAERASVTQQAVQQDGGVSPVPSGAETAPSSTPEQPAGEGN